MILTVGDSFTYGEELPDRIVSAWPYVLSRLLDKPVLNLGKGGGSNQYIIRTVIEQTAKQKFDLVIVGWSDTSRIETWTQGTPTCINHAGRRGIPWVQDYYKHSYDEKFGFRTWFTQVLELQQYLLSINQPYLFVNVAGLQGHHEVYQDEFGFLWDRYRVENYVGWPKDGMLEFQGNCPKGPGGHPLELGHQRIANQIYEHIRHLGWIS
jgi:hypothetical protein